MGFIIVFLVSLQFEVDAVWPPFFLKVGVHFAPPKFKIKSNKIPLSPLFSLAIYFLLQFTLNTTLILFPAVTAYEKQSGVYGRL